MKVKLSCKDCKHYIHFDESFDGNNASYCKYHHEVLTKQQVCSQFDAKSIGDLIYEEIKIPGVLTYDEKYNVL